jgi:SAM-dependent methyltransferase
MPVMSKVERAFCRTGAWSRFAGRAVLPWALAGGEVHGRVLEIGSGAGAMAQQLARRYPEARITASDLDPRMVAAARRRLANQANVEAVAEADVTALPFADATFDTVASFLMLHHVIEWERALAEMLRVVRPDGALIGYDLLDTRATRVVHRLDRSPFRLIAHAELHPALERCGYAQVQTRVSVAGNVVRFAARRPAT